MRAEAVLTQTETPPAAEVAAAEEAAVQETAVQNAAPQDADAQDEAVLDMIAMEMGAPDPISDDEIAEAIAEQVRPAEPAPIAPVIVAKAPEPVVVPPTAAAGSTGGSSSTPAARRRTGARAGSGNVARLEPHRERHAAKAGHGGQRPAGADPAHEPGREDRVLFVEGLRRRRSSPSFHNAPAAFVASANSSLSGCFIPPPTSSGTSNELSPSASSRSARPARPSPWATPATIRSANRDPFASKL